MPSHMVRVRVRVCACVYVSMCVRVREHLPTFVCAQYPRLADWRAPRTTRTQVCNKNTRTHYMWVGVQTCGCEGERGCARVYTRTHNREEFIDSR